MRRLAWAILAIAILPLAPARGVEVPDLRPYRLKIRAGGAVSLTLGESAFAIAVNLARHGNRLTFAWRPEKEPFVPYADGAFRIEGVPAGPGRIVRMTRADVDMLPGDLPTLVPADVPAGGVVEVRVP